MARVDYGIRDQSNQQKNRSKITVTKKEETVKSNIMASNMVRSTYKIYILTTSNSSTIKESR